MSADRAHDAVGDRRGTPTRGAAARTGLLAAAYEVFTSVGRDEAAARVLAVIGRIDITSRG